MSMSELFKKIGALRDQIDRDSTAGTEALEQHKPKAFRILEDLSGASTLPSGTGRFLAQLRVSLQDFYNPKFHSGWRHQFVLHDLKALEEFLRSSQRSNDSDFFLPGLMSAS